MDSEYNTLKIPTELAESIDEIILIRKDLGYKSRAEFVKEAIRKHLEWLEEESLDKDRLIKLEKLIFKIQEEISELKQEISSIPRMDLTDLEEIAEREKMDKQREKS